MAIAVFFVAAAIALIGGIGVVSFHQPIRSVLSLVVVMLALSVEFLLLSAQFIFAVQIIVYAGAVMVLFLFVVALLGLMWAMLQGVQYRQPDAKADMSVFGTVQAIGAGLFTTYLYPFELTSILLLVAAIGAIYLSRKRIDDPEGGPVGEGIRPAAGMGGDLP